MKKAFRGLLTGLGGLFWIVVMLSFSDIKMTTLTVLSALIHKCGHLIMLTLLKKRFSLPTVVTSGFRIKTKSKLSYKEEILVCAAGPFINVLLFLFLLPHTADFAIINLATAISNLLPLPDYDGYKIISNLISLILSSEVSDILMPRITLAVCAMLVFLSLFLIMLLNGGYWIFFIFFIVLVKQILFLQKQIKSEDL